MCVLPLLHCGCAVFFVFPCSLSIATRVRFRFGSHSTDPRHIPPPDLSSLPPPPSSSLPSSFVFSFLLQDLPPQISFTFPLPPKPQLHLPLPPVLAHSLDFAHSRTPFTGHNFIPDQRTRVAGTLPLTSPHPPSVAFPPLLRLLPPPRASGTLTFPERSRFRRPALSRCRGGRGRRGCPRRLRPRRRGRSSRSGSTAAGGCPSRRVLHGSRTVTQSPAPVGGGRSSTR